MTSNPTLRISKKMHELLKNADEAFEKRTGQSNLVLISDFAAEALFEDNFVERLANGRFENPNQKKKKRVEFGL